MQESGERSSTNERGQWSEDQRINAGQIAAQALNSPIFNVIHAMMVGRWQKEIKLTDPKEDNARKWLWMKERVMDEMCLEMASLVQDAQRIIAERQAQNDPVEQERQRLDEQGYGLNFNQQETS